MQTCFLPSSAHILVTMSSLMTKDSSSEVTISPRCPSASRPDVQAVEPLLVESPEPVRHPGFVPAELSPAALDCYSPSCFIFCTKRILHLTYASFSLPYAFSNAPLYICLVLDSHGTESEDERVQDQSQIALKNLGQLG